MLSRAFPGGVKRGHSPIHKFSSQIGCHTAIRHTDGNIARAKITSLLRHNLHYLPAL